MKIEELINRPFTFKRRDVLIPCEFRPMWKSCLIIVIFGITAKKNKCSLKKLHTASWLVKSDEHLSDFIKWAEKKVLVTPDVRFDPSIDKAVDLLVGNRILIKAEGKLEITELGMEKFKGIEAVGVFVEEMHRLNVSNKFLSEASVERLLRAN